MLNLAAESRSSASRSERRRCKRYTTTMRVGRMITDQGDELCLVKNISSDGLQARIYSAVGLETRAHVELTSGQRLSGRVIWARDHHIGLRFDRSVDVEDVLTSTSSLPVGHSARLPRIKLSRAATIRIGTRILRGDTLDMSQGGTKLIVQKPVELGEVVVSITGLYPIRGVVRWREGNVIGVEFNELIPLSRLGAWSRDPTHSQPLAKP